jgi:hypothetical protein
MQVSEYSDEGYDDDESNEATGPKALRDALAKEKKEKRDALKRLADLEAKQAEYDKASRATSLNEALKTAGVKDAAKVAKLYPADGEATADAVAQWVADYKDVFNFGTTSTPDAALDEEGDSKQAPAEVDPVVQHYLDSMGRTKALESERTEGPMDDERLAAAFAEIEKNAKSQEDITAALRQLGARVTGGYDR